MLSKTDTSRRSSLEIVSEILRIARKGSRKTRIVYGANLNFKMLTEYLIKLEEAGLVKLHENGEIETTAKGKEYLEQFRNLKNLYRVD